MSYLKLVRNFLKYENITDTNVNNQIKVDTDIKEEKSSTK